MDVVMYFLLFGLVLSGYFTLDNLLLYLFLLIEDCRGCMADLPPADKKRYLRFLRRGLVLFGLTFLFFLLEILLYPNYSDLNNY